MPACAFKAQQFPVKLIGGDVDPTQRIYPDVTNSPAALRKEFMLMQERLPGKDNTK